MTFSPFSLLQSSSLRCVTERQAGVQNHHGGRVTGGRGKGWLTGAGETGYDLGRVMEGEEKQGKGCKGELSVT